jgi:hypothetical protein
MKMLPEDCARELHKSGSKFQGQERQHQKSHAPPGKDSQQKMPELHFGNRRREHEELERGRRRQHGGEHQAPERMLIEGFVEFLEAFGRNAFPQQLLAAFVADQVNDDTAQCRSGRGQKDIQQKAPAVLIDIGSNHRVHRQAEKGRIHGGNQEHAPRAQRLQQRPQEGAVAEKDVLNSLQGAKDLSLRESPVAGLALGPFVRVVVPQCAITVCVDSSSTASGGRQCLGHISKQGIHCCVSC